MGLEPGVVDDAVQSCASPWALQAERGFMRLNELEEGQDLLEELDGKIVRVFKDKRLAEQFGMIDVSQLRARELSVRVSGSCDLNDPSIADPKDPSTLQCAICVVSFPGKSGRACFSM